MHCHCPHPEFELTFPVKTGETTTTSCICKACGAELPGLVYRAWKELGLRLFHGCQN